MEWTTQSVWIIVSCVYCIIKDQIIAFVLIWTLAIVDSLIPAKVGIYFLVQYRAKLRTDSRFLGHDKWAL